MSKEKPFRLPFCRTGAVLCVLPCPKNGEMGDFNSDNEYLPYALIKKYRDLSVFLSRSILNWRRHPDLNRGVKVLQTSALPLGYGAVYYKRRTFYCVFCRLKWSGRRDSNSRRSPWQGDALPLSHSRIYHNSLRNYGNFRKLKLAYLVLPGGIEPPTLGFSVPCSTD